MQRYFCSQVPVHDGYVLQHAIVKSPLGSDFLTGQCQQFLEDRSQLSSLFFWVCQVSNLFNSSRVELVASYQIKEKKEVAEGAKAKWTRKSNLPEVTKSWHDYQVVLHAIMFWLYFF